MPVYYLDTSALVKRYHVESGSERLDQLFADSASTFITANITFAELISAFDRKFQEGVINEHTLNYVLAVVSRDLVEDFWLIELDRVHVQRSQELILRHHLRTLDALHLAVLLTVRDLAPVLVSADHRLLDAAQREQFAVLNPAT